MIPVSGMFLIMILFLDNHFGRIVSLPFSKNSFGVPEHRIQVGLKDEGVILEEDQPGELMKYGIVTVITIRFFNFIHSSSRY